MKKTMIAVAAGLMLLGGACSKGGNVKLADEADSIAYIIGINVGTNLRQVDSTLRVDAICEGIRDAFDGQPKISYEEARDAYLRYITYEKPEKARAYEEQFLKDFSDSNRSFARSQSGLTYSVEEVGDVQKTPERTRDTVVLRYVLSDVDGNKFYSSFEKKDTLRSTLGDLVPGLQEALRLIGKGGKMQVWIPAAQAYGAAGDKKLGVQPNATLYYEIDLLDVKK